MIYRLSLSVQNNSRSCHVATYHYFTKILLPHNKTSDSVLSSCSVTVIRRSCVVHVRKLGGGASSCMPFIPNFPKIGRVCNTDVCSRVEGQGDRHAGTYRCLQGRVWRTLVISYQSRRHSFLGPANLD
jgi:hypothetical protein